MSEPFLDLIGKYSGFEIVLGFRDDEDHILGGTGNKVWYCVTRGRTVDCFMGELTGGTWTDTHIVKKKALKRESAAPGTAIGMIRDRAYFKQAEIAASGRKPVPVTVCGHAASHYVYSFGARAYEILDAFGVTALYSNVDDERAGWRTRNIFTGSAVEPPVIR